MPRDGSNIYSQPDPDVIADTTIESAKYNNFTNDVAQDLNLPRPIVAGGTAATSAAQALFNITGEKSTQLVADYDTHVWVPGSFRSAVAATSAPNATSTFVGHVVINEALANPPTNNNVVVEARDMTDGTLWVRTKIAGVWSVWGHAFAAAMDAMAYNGLQINGGMEVSQENGTSTVVLANGVTKYVVDGWTCAYFNTGAVFNAAKLGTSGAVLGGTSVYFPFVLFLKSNTQMSALGASDYAIIAQNIEGYRCARLGWGTAGAQPITIGFWVSAAATGTVSVFVRNSVPRCYVTTVAISAANTWVYKTVTIPGDTTSTWGKDHTQGLQFGFCLAAGGSSLTAPNVWSNGAFVGATGATNHFSVANNTCYVTGVTVTPGSDVPLSARQPFIIRPYDQELPICQRYWRSVIPEGAGAAQNTTTALFTVSHNNMRIAPVITVPVALSITNVNSANFTQSSPNATITSNTADAGLYAFPNFTGLATGVPLLFQNYTNKITLDARL